MVKSLSSTCLVTIYKTKNNYTNTSNNTTTSNGSAVATVAMCAYCGSIVSSPLVGLISDISGSLRYGFLFVAIVASGIVPLSLHVPAK